MAENDDILDDETGLPDEKPAKGRKPARRDFDSSLAWYLEQINRIPLLSREEEDFYARGGPATATKTPRKCWSNQICASWCQ
jgi:hypothetical protein